MRKSARNEPHASAGHPGAARLANSKNRPMPVGTVTITAAMHDSPTDIPQWLDATRAPVSLGGGTARAVPGGAQTLAVGRDPARTVALSDGTQITFTPARHLHGLEPI
jgi:hypothetical protein